MQQPVFKGFGYCQTALLLFILTALSGVRADEPPANLVTGGLFYQWYQGAWDKLPDFSKETPSGFGIAQNFDLSSAPANQNFALRYEGYIEIHQAGQYDFSTSSDDGSALYLANQLVVNNDGLHGLQTRTGSVILQPGRYPLRVEFFQRGGGQVLQVGYRTPAGVTSALPLSDLAYDPAKLPVPREADIPSGAIYAGLAYESFQGNWSQLPVFDSLIPVFRGVGSGFDISDRIVNDQFAFRHQGYLIVPQDGLYTFYVASDDGSALYIGNQKVVDNDGLHPLQEHSGAIPLKAGFHRISTGFFEAWGSETLTVQWSGPGLAKSAIPPEALVHTLDMLPPLRQPDAPASPLLPHLAYRAYEGNWSVLPDFASLAPKAYGVANGIDLSPAIGANTHGLSFKGYLQVPQDGVYRFYTTSDDGSRLFIGDQQVVNNDGLHGAVRASGNIALAAGLHALQVDFFQGWGGQVLTVEYRTPDGKIQTLPVESLFHTAEQLPALKEALTTPDGLQPGLAYRYSEGYFNALSPMMAATVRSYGVASQFNLDPRGRDDGFGLVFDGYIDVPEDGYYRFYTASDDGSRLWIDNGLVVDSDGLHPEKTVNGSIGLKAGLHSIRVAYLESGGGQVLKVGYQTPSGQLSEIPASALHHTPAQLPALWGAVTLPANTKTGLAYRYYEGAWSALPDFASLTPVGLGAVNNFSLETATLPDNFALKFEGYIQIPQDGFYDFYTNSDDGSRLWIDDKLVVDNDGLHGARDVVNNIGLAAGWHRIRVGFFERSGGQNLSVSWKIPGGQRSAIPDSALAFEPSALPGLSPAQAAREALIPGLQYSYFEWATGQAQWTALPNLAAMTAKTFGVLDNFNLDLRQRNSRFAMRETGYIDIPEYGFYSFYTTSDDGSRLYIDNQLVVNNDGLHPAQERSGKIGLERGRHLITVDFFQWDGDQILTVAYAGPHFGKTPISNSVLFRLDPGRNGNAGDPGLPEGPSTPASNHLPTARADTASTSIGAGQSVTVNVLANDVDSDGDIPILLGFSPASGSGAALVDAAGGRLIYYPPLGFVGTDTLRYTLGDRRGGTTQGSLVVQVGAEATVRLSSEEAQRFLTQASFGPSKTSIAQVMQKGPEAWINEQLALPATLHASAMDAMRKANESPSQRELRVRAWLDRAVNAPDQLRQRVAFALSQILVVSDVGTALASDQGAAGAADYYDLLVRSAFGSYRQLLGDVTLHPAMGLYLNMAGNKKADPSLGTVADENYAREIMQLFSVGLWQLGADGQRILDAQGSPVAAYGETQVMELAKVFTGWNFATTTGADQYRLPMVLNPALHEDGEKTLIGGITLPANQGGQADLEFALNSLAVHPNLPPFIARELIQRLVTSNPSPAYVGRVAQAFKASGLNLGVAVKAILLDPEARTAPNPSATRDGKVKEPLLQLTALWRALGIAPSSIRIRLDQLAPLGQTPLSAPSVFNFFKPDYQAPGAIAQAGLYSPELEHLNERQVMSSATVIDDWTLGGRSHYDLNMELAFSKANASKAIGHLNLLLMGNQMSPAMLQVLVDVMFDGTGLAETYTDTDRVNRMLGAIYLITTSPEFQTQR